MKKLFTISRFYRTSKWVIVHIRGQVPYNVCRETFESWLERTDRLEYLTEVTPDHRGDPQGGETLTYTLREYWALPSWQIEQHLYEHIIYSQDAQFYDLRRSIDKVLQAAKEDKKAKFHPVYTPLFNSIFNVK